MANEDFKSDKREAIAQVASGIAHDFGNLLTIALINLSEAKASTDNLTKWADTLEEAEKALLKAREMSWQLLSIAKEEFPAKITFAPAPIIKEIAELFLHNALVKHEFAFDDDLWAIKIDEVQFGQIVQNLVINAIQAMNSNGKVKITAENLYLKHHSNLPLNAGRYIKLTVEDEGKGIASENLPKIFEPFFTTKESGSGLGLAICLSIVKKYNGYIEVDSKLGVGTNFRLYLPASDLTIIK